MEDSTLLDGTWLFFDVILLAPPPILVSVLDCKKLYQKRANEMYLAFSMTYRTQAGVLTRDAEATTPRQEREEKMCYHYRAQPER
jgi:hypothetical protein